MSLGNDLGVAGTCLAELQAFAPTACFVELRVSMHGLAIGAQAANSGIGHSEGALITV